MLLVKPLRAFETCSINKADWDAEKVSDALPAVSGESGRPIDQRKLGSD